MIDDTGLNMIGDSADQNKFDESSLLVLGYIRAGHWILMILGYSTKLTMIAVGIGLHQIWTLDAGY